MPRGRQYYDPIIQAPSKVEGAEDLTRIELVPEGSETVDGGEIGRWVGRLINSEGLIAEVAPGDFDHDRALAQAQELWPGLDVYELRSEAEDSTWTGTGLSPRLWQTQASTTSDPSVLVAVEDRDEPPPLRGISAEVPGVYVLLADISAVLLFYADLYDKDDRPSEAKALRTVSELLG